MHDAHQFAVTQHHDLIAQCEHDVEVLTDEQNARSRLFLTIEDVIDEIGRVDVQSADGIRRDEHIGLGKDLAPQENLLDVAARKPTYRRLGRRRNDVKFFDHPFRLGTRRLAVHERTSHAAVDEGRHRIPRTSALLGKRFFAFLGGNRLDRISMVLILFQHHVVRNGHGRRKPHAETVFGDKAHGDSARRDLFGRESDNAVALVINPARFDLSEPRDRLAKFALTAARNARNT